MLESENLKRKIEELELALKSKNTRVSELEIFGGKNFENNNLLNPENMKEKPLNPNPKNSKKQKKPFEVNKRRMSMKSKLHRANPSVYNENHDDTNPSFNMTQKSLDTSIIKPKNTVKPKIDFLNTPTNYKKLPKRILATVNDSKVFDRKPDNFSSLLLNLNSVENLDNVESLNFLNRITKNGVEF